MQELSATAENDPVPLSQLTPMNDKCKGNVNKNLTAENVTHFKLSDPVKVPTTSVYEEIIPAKQSSSKRVKVIKTEKK